MTSSDSEEDLEEATFSDEDNMDYWGPIKGHLKRHRFVDNLDPNKRCFNCKRRVRSGYHHFLRTGNLEYYYCNWSHKNKCEIKTRRHFDSL